MKAKQHTTEQIINKLREAGALLAGRQTVAALCKQRGINEHTYCRRRKKYGNLPRTARQLLAS